MSQNNPVDYAESIQYQLNGIFSPVPVYANFNRNWATEGTFVTWQLRNVHQPVYTGKTQSVKGIDRPVFQMSIFSQSMNTAFNLANDVLQSLHGYAGPFGDITANGFYISKADVVWLYNTYDNELGLNQVILDCTLDVPG